MAMNCDAEIFQLLNKPLSLHSWNSDKSKIAVCPNSEEIVIMKREPSSKWVVEDVLKEHDQLITGLDWCGTTDKLISCSMDRNAYVWARTAGPDAKWKPTLVALRFTKGASCISWNSDGTKFAAGSSNGTVAVGYFEAENDWWVCKHLKTPLENTVTCIDWHPSGNLLAAGSVDGSLLLTSGHIKSIDGDDESKFEATTTSHQFPILDVSFSPNGSKLAFLLHEGKLIVQDQLSLKKSEVTLGDWPMVQVKFVSEELIITTGHSYTPILIKYEKDSDKWTIAGNLVASEDKKESGKSTFGSAFSKFKQMDNCGTSEKKPTSASPGHINTVNKLTLLKDSQGKVSKLSTSSYDGNLIIWDISSALASNSMAKLLI